MGTSFAPSNDQPRRYGAFAQSIHWLTAVLVLVAFIYGLGGPEQQVFSAERALDRQIHETLGLCVFVLTVLRVVWRMFDKRPAPEPSPRWMRVAAAAVQGLLYLLLFAVPMTAIVGSWLAGHALNLLGGVDIAPMLGMSHALGKQILEVHSWLGDVILWLAGFHALAALVHQFVMDDQVFASMLPRWSSADEPDGS